jgi:hypothetical protein
MTKEEKKAIISTMIKSLKLQKKCVLADLDCNGLNKEQEAYLRSGIDIGFTYAIETLKDERDAINGVVDCE